MPARATQRYATLLDELLIPSRCDHDSFVHCELALMRKPDIKEFNVIGPPDHSEDLLKAIWSAGWSSVPEANGACATRDERAATHHIALVVFCGCCQFRTSVPQGLCLKY